jgi:hypothetical protein
LTPEQTAALDLFDALANSPALRLQMEFQAGDIQLVHNHTVLHDRTAFEDWPEPERKRHLLRLWLAPPAAPAARLRRAVRLRGAWRPRGIMVKGTAESGAARRRSDERALHAGL